jgi:hypothetical protein
VPSAAKGQSGYSTTLAESGGTTPLTWSLASGSLPSGLSLSSSGVISGNVSATASSQTFIVEVTDANGVSDTQSLTLNILLEYSGSSSTNIPATATYYGINTLLSAGSSTKTANGLTPGVAETLTGLTFTLGTTSGTVHTATIGLISGSTWTATSLTCSVPAESSTCTISGSVTVPVGDSINIEAVGNGNHTGSWVTTYTQP